MRLSLVRHNQLSPFMQLASEAAAQVPAYLYIHDGTTAMESDVLAKETMVLIAGIAMIICIDESEGEVI